MGLLKDIIIRVRSGTVLKDLRKEVSKDWTDFREGMTGAADNFLGTAEEWATLRNGLKYVSDLSMPSSTELQERRKELAAQEELGDLLDRICERKVGTALLENTDPTSQPQTDKDSSHEI